MNFSRLMPACGLLHRRVRLFDVVLQDDVILADVNLETKIEKLYEWGAGQLGYVSFRLGANFEPDTLQSQKVIPLTEYIENAYGHALPEAETLLPARFAYRTVPIKSPVCLPTHLVREVGLMNESLAPYAHDDTDLAIRITSAQSQWCLRSSILFGGKVGRYTGQPASGHP